MKTIRILVVAALLTVSTAAMALTYDNKGNVTWRFVKTPYSSTHDSTGIPKSIDKRVTVTNDFLTRIAAALPERRDIRTTNPDLITDDFGANVRIKKEADIFVTFLHEGAGYKNSLGYFTFTDDSVPTKVSDLSETIIFPNSSYYNDGGSSKGLKSGDTLKIGHFAAGTNIGFAIVANGFDSKTGVDTDAPVVYYTIKALNPETKAVNKAHTVLLNDSLSGMVVLGLEDLNRGTSGCDHDFNDTIFTVTAEPADAIDVSDLAPVPQVSDADNDGVLDLNDDYPDDGARAFDVFTPSKNSFSTLVFEDSWPLEGDYDMNDVVVRYQYQMVQNRNGLVVDLFARFRLAAWGTLKNNGLALQLPSVTPSEVQSATLSIDGGAAQVAYAEAGQAKLVYRILEDQAAAAVPASCAFYNVQEGCSDGDGPLYTLHITFKAPTSPVLLGTPPWDPFLFRTSNRGVEIHLPDHAPTALADMSLFGTADDNSVPAQGIWYKSVCNLPWSLDIPAEWSWPKEGVELPSAYPDFTDWVTSAGTTSLDWYKTNIVSGLLWTR